LTVTLGDIVDDLDPIHSKSAINDHGPAAGRGAAIAARPGAGSISLNKTV